MATFQVKGSFKPVPPEDSRYWKVKLPADSIEDASNRVAKAIKPLNIHRLPNYHASAITGLGQASNGMYVIEFSVGLKKKDPKTFDKIDRLVKKALSQFSPA